MAGLESEARSPNALPLAVFGPTSVCPPAIGGVTFGLQEQNALALNRKAQMAEPRTSRRSATFLSGSLRGPWRLPGEIDRIHHATFLWT